MHRSATSTTSPGTATAEPPQLRMAPGTCVRGNLVREMPDWRMTLIDCGFHSGPHKIIITTPTGHYYLSRAPDPP
jgi:hypothetical protein